MSSKSLTRKQAALFVIPQDPDLIFVFHKGRSCFTISKEKFLRLHRLFGGQRGLKNKGRSLGIVGCIKSGERNTITFSELRRILGDDKWFFALAPIKKIEEAEQYRVPDTKYHGHVRGGVEQIALQKNIQYISNNISHIPRDDRVFAGSMRGKNLWEIAQFMREMLSFTLPEFRSIKQTGGNLREKFNFLVRKFDEAGIFVFRSHNGNGGMPEKIPGDASFDGASVVSKKNGACALFLNSKIPFFGRRITTMLALLYSIAVDRGNATLYSDDKYVGVNDDAFYFAGYFLFDQNDIDVLRVDLESWEDAVEESKKYGVSPSFLIWFLFFDHNIEKYNDICEEKPEYSPQERKKSKGGVSGVKAFARFYPRDLLQRNISALGDADTSRLISLGGDRKDSKAFLSRVRKEFGL